jgi:hypothetical protein
MPSPEPDKKMLDDPVWPYVLAQRLIPYIPYVRRWWSERADLSPSSTGVFPVTFSAEQPPGLFYRFTRTPIRSPIHGIQAFPFVVSAYLQITGVAGGSTKMVQWVLSDGHFTLEEYTCLEIHNLPSTFNQGQLIAFVPTEMWVESHEIGKWIYFTADEISELIGHRVTQTVWEKAVRKG